MADKKRVRKGGKGAGTGTRNSQLVQSACHLQLGPVPPPQSPAHTISDGLFMPLEASVALSREERRQRRAKSRQSRK